MYERLNLSGGISRLAILCMLLLLGNNLHAFAPLPSHVSSTPALLKLRTDQHYSNKEHLLRALFTEENTDSRDLVATTSVKDDSTLNDEQTYATAIRNTILSIGSAIVFGAGLWATAGQDTGEEFFAAYIVEKSLSVDNLFVFLLLFEFFKIPQQYQNRILNWGIYGSVVMRAIMITLGAAALQNFHGILLVFAGILIYSAVQVLYDVEDEDEEDLNANPVVMFSKNILPYTDMYDGDKFFTIEDGVKKATPLFVCMIAVELSDVVFAVDSIPACFGVTENSLVVFSSNMLAILGLRSLYPVLSKAASDLKYLEPAVAVVLAFIGGKMIAEYFGYLIPTNIALAIIVSLLGMGVGASAWEKQQQIVEPESQEKI